MQRRHRLRHSGTIRAVREHGRCHRHPLLILCFQANQDATSRFCFAVSRRVGNAVVRNRVKRLLRESVRQRLDHIAPGWDCVFIARNDSAAASYAALDAAVVQLLTRARLLQDAGAPGSGD